jgi:formylglycine-generating enzyme required for sulfatase activity
MHATTSLCQRYVDQAVSCRVHAEPGGPARRLRVAATLLTCELAAQLLNDIGLPPEPACSYRYVNVHNPRRPVRHDARRGGWSAVPGLDWHPVWGLNWAAAVLVCRQLGARLPWVAEWESFASGGDDRAVYPWGDAAPSFERANYDEHYAGTTPVARFEANALGLYDLAGNLDEWCQDAPATGHAGERIVKGGAWSKSAAQLRIKASRAKWERLGTTTIGVRPVWDEQ